MDAAVFANCVFPCLTSRERVKLRGICREINKYVLEDMNKIATFDISFDNKIRLYLHYGNPFHKIDKKYEPILQTYDRVFVQYNGSTATIFMINPVAPMDVIFCGKYKKAYVYMYNHKWLKRLSAESFEKDEIYLGFEIAKLIYICANRCAESCEIVCENVRNIMK